MGRLGRDGWLRWAEQDRSRRRSLMRMLMAKQVAPGVAVRAPCLNRSLPPSLFRLYLKLMVGERLLVQHQELADHNHRHHLKSRSNRSRCCFSRAEHISTGMLVDLSQVCVCASLTLKVVEDLLMTL